jgi:hypothetical protein
MTGRPFPDRCAGRVLSRRRQSGRHRRKPLRSRLRPPRAGAGPRAAVLSGVPGRHEPGGAGGRCVLLSVVLGVHVAFVLGAGHGASPRTGQRQGRLYLSGDGELRHAGAAVGLRPAGGSGGGLRVCRHPRGAAYDLSGRAGADPAAARGRIEGRPGAVACLAAAGASGRAQPRFGADERRDDQGRDLRLHPRHLRPAGAAVLAGERGRAVPRRRHRRHRDPVRHDGEGPEAAIGLLDDREYWHHLREPRPCCSMCSTTPSSRACCSSAPAPS